MPSEPTAASVSGYTPDQQNALHRLQDAVERCVRLDVAEEDIDSNVEQAFQWAVDDKQANRA